MMKPTKRILAVDDSQPMRKLVALVLNNAGYEVTTVANGTEALERFKNENYDLVVTDMNMPVMHGVELIRSIRATDSEVPILALTTESDPTIQQRGAKAGANGWVVKPFQHVPFVKMVARIFL